MGSMYSNYGILWVYMYIYFFSLTNLPSRINHGIPAWLHITILLPSRSHLRSGGLRRAVSEGSSMGSHVTNPSFLGLIIWLFHPYIGGVYIKPSFFSMVILGIQGFLRFFFRCGIFVFKWWRSFRIIKTTSKQPTFFKNRFVWRHKKFPPSTSSRFAASTYVSSIHLCLPRGKTSPENAVVFFSAGLVRSTVRN